jgi:tRNA pseudouridine55 synthase
MPQLQVSVAEATSLEQGRRLVREGVEAAELACAIDPAGRLVALVQVDPYGEVRVRRGFSAGIVAAERPA